MEEKIGRRPNILFCVADDAGMHFGAYGCPWVHTPAFDRVAREGVVFQQAYTCNSKCAPSRAAILTGRNSWQWSFGKRPVAELYNIARDPDCLHNLAGEREFEALRATLAKQLFKELGEQNDPRIIGGGTPLDENPCAYPELRNFHQRFCAGEADVPGWIDPGDIQAE